MTNAKTMTLLLAAVVCAAGSGIAQAALPADIDVVYYLRETPSNPESDILYRIGFELTAVSQDGDFVAWKIAELTIIELGVTALDDRVWVEVEPDLSAYEGVWWVEHANPEKPVVAEFADVPYFDGLATAEDPNDADMEYELKAGYCDASCQAMYDGSVTAMNYRLRLEGEDDPEAEEEDFEPIEIEDSPIYS